MLINISNGYEHLKHKDPVSNRSLAMNSDVSMSNNQDLEHFFKTLEQGCQTDYRKGRVVAGFYSHYTGNSNSNV